MRYGNPVETVETPLSARQGRKIFGSTSLTHTDLHAALREKVFDIRAAHDIVPTRGRWPDHP
jgi:hypothetical protein